MKVHKTIKNNLDLKCLQTNLLLLFSEDQIYLQMVNFLSFQLEFGNLIKIHSQYAVLICLEKITLKSQVLWFKLVINLLLFVNFVLYFSKKKILKVDYLSKAIIWYLQLQLLIAFLYTIHKILNLYMEWEIIIILL